MTDRFAWAHSGVEKVGPAIHRIPVRMPGEGLAAINSYAYVGAKGIGLVDTGWLTDDATADLTDGLESLGAGLGDVSFVAVTHAHPDHYTIAVEMRRRTGCTIVLGEGERESLTSIMSGDHGRDAFIRSLVRCGVPPELAEDQFTPVVDSAQYEYPSLWLADGDTVELGGASLNAIATPGHTRGHFCFADEDSGLMFTGDHVLPAITPSVGHESGGREQLPLAAYLRSLARLKELPDAAMMPAHGPVGMSVHLRVDELLEHHDVRLNECGDALAAGDRTAFDVAQRLTWTKRRSLFAELRPVDQLMAVHETKAHLEVLDLQARIVVDITGDVDEYQLS